MARTPRQEPNQNREDTPSSRTRMSRPRKNDRILQGAIYVHSADPTGNRGYILKQWFRPTREQISSMQSARVARAGYWVREAPHTLRPVFKCCITDCVLCEQATERGVNPVPPEVKNISDGEGQDEESEKQRTTAD